MTCQRCESAEAVYAVSLHEIAGDSGADGLEGPPLCEPCAIDLNLVDEGGWPFRSAGAVES